ncbi:MAG: glycosyltransferase family 2 protein [Patescibacteria group bacterium]|nr:glycosyltransferase family 2 protein [Patescibacteria group bacterium]
MLVSIIIPAYNEEKTVGKLLEKVKKVEFGNGISKEIILVDDASIDKTLDIVKKFEGIKVINHKKNLGKGAAIRSGIKVSNGDIIAIQDADLEYNPSDLVRLVELVYQNIAEVAYGTRLQNYPLKIIGAKKTPLVTHYLGNKFLTFCTNLLYGSRITDMETCYKVFKRSVLSGIKIKSNRFDFEPEITAKILKKGIKIHEIPISVKPRGYEEGKKISWKDGLIALWTLIKFRFSD